MLGERWPLRKKMIGQSRCQRTGGAVVHDAEGSAELEGTCEGGPRPPAAAGLPGRGQRLPGKAQQKGKEVAADPSGLLAE